MGPGAYGGGSQQDCWLAGMIAGPTAPVENPVDVHDLHATMLHLLGFDHTKLTYRFQGRDYRLTDVTGDVITELEA